MSNVSQCVNLLKISSIYTPTFKPNPNINFLNFFLIRPHVLTDRCQFPLTLFSAKDSVCNEAWNSYSSEAIICSAY